jgi:hypothetical protein
MSITVTAVHEGRTRTFVVDTWPRLPLDPVADETFAAWCATPSWDNRTLEEFAASGGSRIAPAHIQPDQPWPRS